MKCPNCGAEIGTSRVCSFCGSNISSTMLREQEVLRMKGCPSCGSTNIQFRRENQGEIRGKNAKQVIYRTVGFCKDCGSTWYPNSPNSSDDTLKPKRKTWLWVLGWIFIFPVPLTVLMLRKKDMKPILKYGIILIGWLFYFTLAKGDGGNSTATPADEPTYPTAIEATDTPVLEPEQTIQPSAEPLSQYDVIDYFVEQFNTISEHQLTNPTDIDIQAPDHYRTEYRLNAYRYAIARQYRIEDTTMDIVLYGGLREGHNKEIRFYLSTADEQLASSVLDSAIRIFDSSMSNSEVISAVDAIKNHTSGEYVKALTYYYIPSYPELFVNCSNIDFYTSK